MQRMRPALLHSPPRACPCDLQLRPLLHPALPVLAATPSWLQHLMRLHGLTEQQAGSRAPDQMSGQRHFLAASRALLQTACAGATQLSSSLLLVPAMCTSWNRQHIFAPGNAMLLYTA